MRALWVLALIVLGMNTVSAQPAREAIRVSSDPSIAAALAALEKGGNTVLIVPRADETAASEAPARMTLSEKIASLRIAFDPVLANVPKIPAQTVEALYGAGGGSLAWMGRAGLVTLASLLVGLAGAFVVSRILGRAVALMGPGAPATRSGRIAAALGGIARGWAAAAAFFGAGAVAALLIEPVISPARVTALMTLGGTASFLTVRAVVEAVLAPRRPHARLVALSDRLARALALQLKLTLVVTLVIAFGCFWFGYFPLEPLAHQFLLAVAPLFSVVVFSGLVVWHRRAITAAVLGEAPRPRPMRRIAAGLWLPLALLYLAVSGAVTVMAVGIEHRLVTGPVLAPALAFVIGMGVTGLLFIVQDRHLPRTVLNERWCELCERVAIGVGTIVGVWSLALMWDAFESPYAAALNHGLVIAIVVLAAWTAWRAVRLSVDERLAEEIADARTDGEGEGFGPGASRLATLLPIVRNVMLFLIGAVVLMAVLASLGVNIGPLFAGAGVVGLAIGFGAQSLIRDVFSGAFFLLDDAFRRGEYVEVAGITGQVEKISVRSFQLRHHEGALHTLPFGEIRQLTNYSRDWVIMKLPIRLTYDTDVEQVRKLIKTLGQEMAADPELGPLFLEPPKSQGVVQMEDSAMIIRVKFKTRPGDQFLVRRHVFQRLRDVFKQHDIHFAHREVTVRVTGTEDEDTRRRAALAAVRAEGVEASDFTTAVGATGL